MKVALLCPNWIGDLVMATPALRAIRRRLPLAHLVAVHRPHVAGVLDGLDLVDECLVYCKHPGGGGLAGLPLIGTLRRQQFDLAVLFPNSFRSAAMAWLGGARRRVGIDRNGRGWLLTDRIPALPHNDPTPVIDEYNRIARHLGGEPTAQMELAVTLHDEQQLSDFWTRQGAGRPGAEGLVCLNPGGAFGAAKHWPAGHFTELARRIAVELGRRVLILCGPAEREIARQIVEAARHPAVSSLADEDVSVGLTKAAIRSADLLITTDSGPRHFAPPFGVPVVTLFGPTHRAWSETYYERSLHLQLDLECGPCQQRVCPLRHHRCMRELTPAWVFRAAVSLLQQHPRRQQAA